MLRGENKMSEQPTVTLEEFTNATYKGAYLSDALVYESFKLGKLNLIVAPCGSGKTTAAFGTIPQYLNVAPQKSLILINTVAGAEEFVQNDLAYFYDYNGKEWDTNFLPQYDKPTIMTYAFFGAQLKKGIIHTDDYDYIVCDELHALNTYIGMARGKLVKQYPQAAPWEINDMLQMTCFTYIAVERIERIVKEGLTWVFALTATPAQLYRGHLQHLSAMINEVQFSQKLHAYEIFCKFDYKDIEPILRAVIPANRKRLFFFNTIKELKQYRQVLLEAGRAAEALWSTTATEKMDTHQLTTRDHLLNDHTFPEDIQDLLINSAYETAISIKDPLVKEAYIHTSSTDTREQARNRLRQDLEVVGYYNKSARKDAKRAEKNLKTLEEYVDLIPEFYFERPLTTADKAELIEVINFPRKWTSLKKAMGNAGLIVEDKSTGKIRYSIIHENLPKFYSGKCTK